MHIPMRDHFRISYALLCSLCVLLACTARAYDIKYSPFISGKTPPSYPMQRCEVLKTFTNTEREVTTWVLQAPKAAGVALVVTRTLEANTIRIVNRQTGQQLLAPAEIEGWMMGNEAPEVSAGLLNEDTTTDFVLLTNAGGSGRGGQRFFRLFMLSVSNTYQAYGLWTYNAGREDFVDLNKDCRAEMIHTAFVPAEAGKDGRAHNCWVFHLLRFTETKAIPADHLRSGFPYWIFYIFKENHRPTDQLTDRQKIQAWKAWVPDDICTDAKDWPAI